LIEGCGLWLEASWAGYMAVISTSVFLPVEFDEVPSLQATNMADVTNGRKANPNLDKRMAKTS
jgi:uncharacterized membrane protein (DUF2068 family)